MSFFVAINAADSDRSFCTEAERIGDLLEAWVAAQIPSFICMASDLVCVERRGLLLFLVAVGLEVELVFRSLFVVGTVVVGSAMEEEDPVVVGPLVEEPDEDSDEDKEDNVNMDLRAGRGDDFELLWLLLNLDLPVDSERVLLLKRRRLGVLLLRLLL